CPLDCPDSCSLDVGVESGRVVSVGGSRANPVTAGYICAKVRRFPERLYGRDRVLHPLVRSGPKGSGEFRRAGWDETLDIVAEKLRDARDRFGGESILPYSYGGSNGYLSQDTADERLFRRLGASRLDRTICAAPTSRAAKGLYGKMPGVSYEDYPEARLVVVWGANPSVTGIHLVPKIYEAQKRGARLVVVDPRATPLVRRADLHLAVRPGTDLPVALALIDRLFETGRADGGFLAAHATGTERLREAARDWPVARAAEVAGAAVDDLERLAAWYAEASPALVRCGWGLERNRNGGSAAAAVLALPAVAGKFGVRGGGYTMSNSAAWKFDSASVSGGEPADARLVNMNRLGEALEADAAPSVKVLFVYNSNALATAPNQERVRRGLRREDLFTVVFDQVMTDTAREADVVLPATSFFEHREMSRGYGAYALHDTRPVAAPAGEARSNVAVFSELCRRTGVAAPGDLETEEGLADAILAQSPRAAEIRTALDAGGVAFPEFGARPIQFRDVFPRTSDGRIHLFPEELDREAPDGLYAFRALPEDASHPLTLISPASDRMISSTLGELVEDLAPLEIHPEDAGPRGIRSGDRVRAFNGLGEVITAARVTDDVRPGVVRLPKGLWAKHTINGRGANALCPDTLTDLGGGACFNDARIEVRRIEIPSAR
ncbi:MAG TPA: molybdopterin-dependent oxidoreductase, partial [Thermoanaerobaculia bacterium]|nr:molybdopterin-dependent oxidoreductase [Thermoanaerobaculia bacterium]